MNMDRVYDIAWVGLGIGMNWIKGHEALQVVRHKDNVYIAIDKDSSHWIESYIYDNGTMDIRIIDDLPGTDEWKRGLTFSEAQGVARHLANAWKLLEERLRIEEQYREKFGFFGDCGTYTGDENGNENE